MPTKNEADRWLYETLFWLTQQVEHVLVYDDQSTDNTVEISREFENVEAHIRPDPVPSFLDHEGLFRQAAWDCFVEHCQPTEDDWVLVIDADEFLVRNTDDQPREQYLLSAMMRHVPGEVVGVSMWVPEVFGFDSDGIPQIRLDGFWANNFQIRLLRYLPHGRFPLKAMACGSVPTYVLSGALVGIDGMSLLHYGYARAVDREAKYQRYTGHPTGHHPGHIESIRSTPLLAPWRGAVPARML